MASSAALLSLLLAVASATALLVLVATRTHTSYDPTPRQGPLLTPAARGLVGTTQQHESAPLRHGESEEERVRESLGCAKVEASSWVRELCFDGSASSRTWPSPEGGRELLEVTLRLAVRVVDKGGAASAPRAPCNDTYRFVFDTDHALVAPHAQDELICGSLELRVVLPPEGLAGGLRARVWLAHVDGEGLADPPEPIPFPTNLWPADGSKVNGPYVYNLNTRFPGALRAPETFAAPLEPLLWDAADAMGAGTWPLPPAPTDRALLRCPGGDTPGRWVLRRTLYAHARESPLEWRPFGCRHRRVTGAKLRRCFDTLLAGGVRFAGESTLGEVYEAWLAHYNRSNHYWPTHYPKDARRAYPLLHKLRGQGEHSEFHGMRFVVGGIDGNGGLVQELREHPAETLVVLQGANDAARETIASFRPRLETLFRQLEEARLEGWLKLRTLVWVTAPTRHYKPSGGPGFSQCNGSKCVAVRNHVEAGTSGDPLWFAWDQEGRAAAEPPRFYGTLARRRLLNREALRFLDERGRNVASRTIVVDYDAITAALPSDFNYDGEHWGCRYLTYHDRADSPYQCVGTANVVVANAIASVIGCGD